MGRNGPISWPFPPVGSINWVMPKDTYISVPKKMHLPSAQDLAQLICQAGKGAYLYNCNISSTYRQLLLDLVDWPWSDVR